MLKESFCLFPKSKQSIAMGGGRVQQRALLVLAGQGGTEQLGTGQEPLYVWSDLRKVEPFLRVRELSRREVVQGMVPSLGQYKARHSAMQPRHIPVPAECRETRQKMKKNHRECVVGYLSSVSFFPASKVEQFSWESSPAIHPGPFRFLCNTRSGSTPLYVHYWKEKTLTLN